MEEYENLNVYHIDCEKYIINGEIQNLPHNTFEMDGEEVAIDSERILKTESNDALYCTFIISCDNEEDNNSFTFEQFGDDDFVIEQNRNKLEVYIKPNKSPFEKNFTITCTHANDSEVYVQIYIVQKEDIYSLNITETEDVVFNQEEELYVTALDSIIIRKNNNSGADMNYNFFQERDITIEVLGGSGKYEIESILKCHIDDTDEENVTVTYRTFDDGFKYNIFPDKIVLVNYGRPFLEEKDYYLIKLHHKDFSELKTTLKVTYAQTDISSIPNRMPHIQRPTFNVEDVYESYRRIKESIQEMENIEEVVEEVVCEIRFDEDLGNGLVVYGQPTEKRIPFSVYENGEVSNLMVKTYSSGNWCSVSTDKTNRILLIKMKDKPIFPRKTQIKVTIIDYPEVFVSFILTNKPN